MVRKVASAGRLVMLVFMVLNVPASFIIAGEIFSTTDTLNSYVDGVNSILKTLPGYGSVWYVQLPSLSLLYSVALYIVFLSFVTLCVSYWLYRDGVNIRRLQNIVKEKE